MAHSYTLISLIDMLPFLLFQTESGAFGWLCAVADTLKPIRCDLMCGLSPYSAFATSGNSGNASSLLLLHGLSPFFESHLVLILASLSIFSDFLLLNLSSLRRLSGHGAFSWLRDIVVNIFNFDNLLCGGLGNFLGSLLIALLFVILDSLTNTYDEMSVVHKNFAKVLNWAETENKTSNHWSSVVHKLLHVWVDHVTNQLFNVRVIFDNSVNDLSCILEVRLLKFSGRLKSLKLCRHWHLVCHWNCLSHQVVRVEALGTELAFACNEVLALSWGNPCSRGGSQSCCDFSGCVVNVSVLPLDCQLLYGFSAWDKVFSIDV